MTERKKLFVPQSIGAQDSYGVGRKEFHIVREGSIRISDTKKADVYMVRETEKVESFFK